MAVAEKRRTGARLRYEQLLSERQASATAIAVSRGPNSRRQRDLDDELSQASQEFLATQSELSDRPPNVKLESQIVFWASASIIFLCEAAFNRVVVEMAAPLPGWLAFAIAGLVSAILMVFAHLAGSLLRQMWSEINRSFYVMNVLLGLALIAIDVVAVLAIVSLRVYFSTVDLTGAIDIFQTAGTVISLGTDLLGKALGDPEAITLGGINALALFLAFIFGLLSHDSEREYDTRYRTLKTLSRQVKRSVDRYEALQEAVFTRHRRALSRAVRSYVGNGGSIADLPKDDFKAQRQEAESAPAAASTTGPATIRPITAVAARGSAAR